MTTVFDINDSIHVPATPEVTNSYFSFPQISNTINVPATLGTEFPYYNQRNRQYPNVNRRDERSVALSPRTVYPLLHKRPKRRRRRLFILSPTDELGNAAKAKKPRRRRASTGSSGGRLIYPDKIKKSHRRRRGSFYGFPAPKEVKGLGIQSNLGFVSPPGYCFFSKIRSSVRNYVRKLHDFEEEGVSQNDDMSPQIARLEHKWTRELSGYRFEIKISRQQLSDEDRNHSFANKGTRNEVK